MLKIQGIATDLKAGISRVLELWAETFTSREFGREGAWVFNSESYLYTVKN